MNNFMIVHMKLFDCENIINQVKMVIATLPRCTLFTRSVIFIFKVVVYNRHKYHVNHRIQSERLLTVPIFATMEITKKSPSTGQIPFAQPVVRFWSQESLCQMSRYLTVKSRLFKRPTDIVYL